jgi:hypothetical protein
MSTEGYGGAAYMEEPQDTETILEETWHIAGLKGSSERFEALPYQRVAFQGIYHALENPEYRELVKEAMFLNKPESTISPLYVVQRLVRVSHTIAWQRNAARYPLTHKEVGAWDATHRLMLDAERPDYEQFYGRAWQFMGKDIMTNKAERGNMIQLVAALHNKTTKALTIFEFGSSMNHILHALRLASRGNYTFGAVEVAKRATADEHTHLLPRQRIAVDGVASALVNDLIQKRPLKLKQAIGFDIANPDDPGTKRWVRGSSHYVDEVLDKSLLREFTRLSRTASATVHSVYPVDIGTPINPSIIETKAPGVSDKADISFLSFSWYELKDRDSLATAVDNAINLTKEDGLVIVYDAVDINQDSGEPTFYDPRRPWTCAVYVLDKQAPEHGFQKYFSVETGRGRRIIVEPIAAARLAVQAATIR